MSRDPDPHIFQLLQEAWERRSENEYGQAKSLVQQAHALCGENQYNALGRIFHIYMQFEADHDNLEEALRLCQKSIAFYQQANNQQRIAHAKRHCADLLQQIGRTEEAEEIYVDVLQIYRADPTTQDRDLANALSGFGKVLAYHKKTARAINVWREVLQLYRASGITAGVKIAEQRLGELASG